MSLEGELRNLAARHPRRFGRGVGLIPFTEAVEAVKEVEALAQRVAWWGCPQTAKALRSVRYLLFDDDAAVGGKP